MFLKFASDTSYKFVFHVFRDANVTNFSKLKSAIYVSPFCCSYVKFLSCFFIDGPVVWKPQNEVTTFCCVCHMHIVTRPEAKRPLYTASYVLSSGSESNSTPCALISLKVFSHLPSQPVR